MKQIRYSAVMMIAIDIETKDPNLKELGDGSMRKDGHIICVSLYDGHDAVCTEPDDPRLADWLASDEDKVFHNGMYDLSWLVLNRGFKVNGMLYDTMTRAALINEWLPSYALQACCEHWNVQGKDKTGIEEWGKQHGISNVMQSLAEIYAERAGKEAVRKYCIQDTIATYMLYKAQENEICFLGLKDVEIMEATLTRCLLEMKRNGVRFSKQRVQDVKLEIAEKMFNHFDELESLYGITKEMLNSPKQLGVAMNRLGIASPLRTPSGAESWSQQALGQLFGTHPVIELIANTKVEEKILSTYIKGTFGTYAVGDRIYATYYSCHKDDGGTRTGRLACRNPNMQQIPARDIKNVIPVKGYGPLVRSIIIPEDDCYLGAFDYSQIEYLVLSHFAIGPKSDFVRQKAWEGVDFHTLVMEMIGSTNRTLTKTFNYAAIYGMGLNTMRNGTSRKFFVQGAKEAGIDFDTYTKQLYDNYFEQMGFIRPTMQNIEREAMTKGYCRNLSGRICHAPPAVFNPRLGKKTIPYYVMTNYKIQGSSADILKRGLVDAYAAGIFDTLVLHATVHDENVFSIPKTKAGAEAAKELVVYMESAYKDTLKVPMKVDTEIGYNWGDCTKDMWKEFNNGFKD